ncbi:MAG: APC family permease [Actinomycetota bacterium]|nr:APC family permease [Actinomycetota bacterium]
MVLARARQREAPRAGAPAAPATMRREVGFLGLLFVSVGSIIGSGWLLGALGASEQAGPASVISWGLGAVVVVLLALVYAELGAAYPLAGGTLRYPHFAFGSTAGFTAGWLAWIGSVTLAPIEVEAALQYLTGISWLSFLTHATGGTAVLTGPGYGVAVALLALFTVVNAIGVRHFARTNVGTVWWKLAIPALTVGALFAHGLHWSNLHAGGGFAPFGARGVLAALPAGVVFAYQGFEQAVQLGAEAKRPERHLAPAVIGAVAIGVVLYLLLELVFIGSLSPAALVHGWANPIGKGTFGPFASIATRLGMGWLAAVLYVDAFVSPAGTGLVYTGTSSRVLFALGEHRYLPDRFVRLDRRGVPLVALLASFAVGLLLLLPFPGWQELVGFITSATALMYALAPLSFAALRRQDPDRPRPFRLPAERVFGPVSFVAANLIFYWAGWPTDWRLLAAIAIGVLFATASAATRRRAARPPLDLHTGWWVPPWLAGMGAISYLGQFGGRHLLPFWWDLGVVAAFSLGVYAAALATRRSGAAVRAELDALRAEGPELS